MPARVVTLKMQREFRRLLRGGETPTQIAPQFGVCRQTVVNYGGELAVPDFVANDLLREAFLDAGVTAHQVALRLGWLCKMRNSTQRKGDDSRVKRTLGILPTHYTRGQPRRRERIHRDTALLLADAIGVDPVEVGL